MSEQVKKMDIEPDYSPSSEDELSGSEDESRLVVDESFEEPVEASK